MRTSMRRVRSCCLQAVGLIVALHTANSAAHAQQGAAADDADITPLLREASRAGQLDGMRWPRYADYRYIIDSLYSMNRWRPVWPSGGRPAREAREALE